MQTKRFEAAATTFSRVSAAPPPLMRAPSAVASSAPSIYRFRSPAGIQFEFLNARGAQFFGGLARTRDRAGKPYFAVFQHFDELVYGGAGADTQHHAAFDVAQRGFCGAAFFFR